MKIAVTKMYCRLVCEGGRRIFPCSSNISLLTLEEMLKKISNIDRKKLKPLQAYEWPGNVRELQNVIQRAVILSDSGNFAVVTLGWCTAEAAHSRAA